MSRVVYCFPGVCREARAASGTLSGVDIYQRREHHLFVYLQRFSQDLNDGQAE